MIEEFSIENEALTVKIKRKGAELSSVKDKASGREFIWQAHQVWQRHAPILFPVVGSLLDHEYRYKGKTYPMTHHGFARDLDFEMLQQSEHSISLVLGHNEQTWRNYPFDFILMVTYTLAENGLKQTFRVLNEGEEEMPVSFGGHPAFAVDDVTDYTIVFEKEESVSSNCLEGPYISQATKSVIDRDRIPLSANIFDEDALIFQELASRRVALKSNTSSHAVSVDFGDFPYLGIWSKPAADFVCIEPWQGLADYLTHDKEIITKKGVVILQSGAEIRRSFTMTFNN